MRSLLLCAAALTLCATTTPAVAAVAATTPAIAASTPAVAVSAKVVYGYAWTDGKNTLTIVPKTATLSGRVHAFKAVPGARKLKLDYSETAYGRTTLTCDAKEQEGRVAVDANGLGKTACKPRDLTFRLSLAPAPVRVEYSGMEAVKVNEVLTPPMVTHDAEGTIKRVSDDTITFTSGGKTVKLRYNWSLSFLRTTKACGDGWLSGKPVHADKDGRGTLQCKPADLAGALKRVRFPVLAEVDYHPASGQVFTITELFRDA